MTTATTFPASALGVEIADTDSPSTFRAPCGLTTRGINRTKNVNQVAVPDCDDPDLAPWLTTDQISRGWTVEGSGLLSEEYAAEWEAFFNANAAKAVKLTVGDAIYLGEAVLTQYNASAPNGGHIEITVTLTGNGALTPTT